MMYNMLICDDENYILDSLANSFQWESYGIRLAAKCLNGQQALNKFKINDFDIAILDIKMPILSGLALAKEIRNMNRSTEIIFLTSVDEFEYAKEAISLDACEYILKPFTNADIIKAVQKALRNLGGNKEAAEEPPQTTAESQIVLQINEYINSNIDKRITVKQIADYFSYSTNYIGHLYKKNTGIFLNDYIIKVKMEKAIELLKIVHNNVNEVAKALGYKDNPYFIKQFREYYGVTPKVYKDKC